MQENVKAEAAEMYANGAAVNAVSKKLGITWWEAKKLQPGGAAVQKPKAPKKKPAPEPEEEEIATWDLTLQLPSERLDEVFATFTAKEKASAIGSVLQNRMDEALGIA